MKVIHMRNYKEHVNYEGWYRLPGKPPVVTD